MSFISTDDFVFAFREPARGLAVTLQPLGGDHGEES